MKLLIPSSPFQKVISNYHAEKKFGHLLIHSACKVEQKGKGKVLACTGHWGEEKVGYKCVKHNLERKNGLRENQRTQSNFVYASGFKFKLARSAKKLQRKNFLCVRMKALGKAEGTAPLVFKGGTAWRWYGEWRHRSTSF